MSTKSARPASRAKRSAADRATINTYLDERAAQALKARDHYLTLEGHDGTGMSPDGALYWHTVLKAISWMRIAENGGRRD